MNSMLNKHTVAIITLESSALPRAGKYTSLSDIIIELDSIDNEFAVQSFFLYTNRRHICGNYF